MDEGTIEAKQPSQKLIRNGIKRSQFSTNKVSHKTIQSRTGSQIHKSLSVIEWSFLSAPGHQRRDRHQSKARQADFSSLVLNIRHGLFAEPCSISPSGDALADQ